MLALYPYEMKMQQKNTPTTLIGRLNRLIVELKSRQYSARTIDAYTTCVKIFLQRYRKHLPWKPLQNIQKDDVIQFVVMLHDEGRTPKTVNLYKEAIKYFAREILYRPEVADIKLSREPKRLPVVLTKAEIESLFAAAHNPKHRYILMLAYAAGLRISEVRSLRVQDLDLEECVVMVRGGKGNKDRLTVLSPKIIAWLQQLCAGRLPTDYVFTSERGGALHVRTLGEIFHHAKKRAGITKPASFHSLRHSFATHLIEQGTDIRHIQALLGHANIRTTQGYTHVTRPQVRKIVSPL